jgi:hypothetical protein
MQGLKEPALKVIQNLVSLLASNPIIKVMNSHTSQLVTEACLEVGVDTVDGHMGLFQEDYLATTGSMENQSALWDDISDDEEQGTADTIDGQTANMICQFIHCCNVQIPPLIYSFLTA